MTSSQTPNQRLWRGLIAPKPLKSLNFWQWFLKTSLRNGNLKEVRAYIFINNTEIYVDKSFYIFKVRPYKIQKISFRNDYPCPCRKKGKLKPILLTEALGCERCQQIFVVQENGQTIEQLSSIYHKKSWRWTGCRWASAYDPWKKTYLLSAVSIVVFFTIAIVSILLSILQSLTAKSMIFWIIVLVAPAILMLLILLAIYRH